MAYAVDVLRGKLRELEEGDCPRGDERLLEGSKDKVKQAMGDWWKATLATDALTRVLAIPQFKTNTSIPRAMSKIQKYIDSLTLGTVKPNESRVIAYIASRALQTLKAIPELHDNVDVRETNRLLTEYLYEEK